MRKAMFVLVIMTIGAVLLVACGTPQPVETPTIMALVTTSVPPVVTATTSTDTPPPPTPTATSLPTDTPLPPTPTATPLPTDTPPPTPTVTPARPTATVARPTKTPAPPPPRFPWRGQIVGTFSNCALTRLMGLTLDRNGGVAGDIWVHFWADGWDGAWARSSWEVDEGYPGLDDSSNWDGILDIYPKAGTWYVCVVPAEGSWDCISTKVMAQTVAEPCAPDSGGVQIVRIVFQKN